MEHHPHIAAHLEVDPGPEGLVARLRFENRGSKKGYVNKHKAGLEGPPITEVFVVTTEAGEEVPYTGRMVKRGPFRRGDFVTLAPGESVDATIDLGPLYDWSPTETTYTIRYEAVHEEPGWFGDLWEIRSNPVTVRHAPPASR